MRIDPRIAVHVAIWSYTVLHLLLAAALPLAAHEAHYGLYARDLQLSYLDHPPLVAWLQSLVMLGSTSDFAMRLMPIGLSVLAQYLLARLAKVVFPGASRWLALVSVLVLQGTLVFHGSMTLSPDVPLVPLAVLVVLVSIRCVEQPGMRHWLSLGALLGLAGLAKYTAVTLGLSVALVMVLRQGWRGLFSPGLWLSGAVAVVLISPVLWWNWQNDWATLQFHSDYQFEDIERWSGVNFLRSMAEQIAYYSPLLVVGGIACLWQLRHKLRSADGRAGRDVLLSVFVAPVLLLFLVTALESRASPHWSMLGWILLIPLLGNWLLGRWRNSRSIRALAGLSLTYSVLILLALPLLAIPIGTWPEFRHPVRQLIGWQEAAAHGEQLRKLLPPRGRSSPAVILARNWHHAGLLGWYLPDTEVRNLFVDINPHNLRNGVADHTTWGVLVYPRASHEPRMKDLTRDFDCQPIDALPIYFGKSLLQTYHYYGCYSKLEPEAQ